MTMQKSKNKFTSLATVLTLLATSAINSGCGVIAATSVAGAGSMVSDERSVGTQIDDRMISSRVKNALISSKSTGMWNGANVSVVEGRVMLSGTVPSEDISREATKLTWNVQGVKEVINELTITKSTVGSSAKDIWIANQIRARLLIEKNLLSSNYKVDVTKNIVFLIGVAQDENELEKALEIAASVSGVERVVNHVITKNDPRRWNRV